MKSNDPQQFASSTAAVDYESTVARYQQLVEKEAGIVANDCGSRLLTHGASTPHVYILVHGTTNSPKQWVEFGQMLHALGHNVLVPRMPYHGLRSMQVTELAQLTANDLNAFGHKIVGLATGLGQELTLIGASGGGSVAAWTAVVRQELKRTLLLVPFFGFHRLPYGWMRMIHRVFGRLPNLTAYRPGEPVRHWAYRGQCTYGVIPFLDLGFEIQRLAQDGVVPRRQIIVVTTAVDKLANNDDTARVAELWRKSGVDVIEFEFDKELAIPHNSIDLTTERQTRQHVYQKMLSLLGEHPY